MTRRLARESYKRFNADPHHPSLRFKQVHPVDGVYSVRVGLGYRALGVMADSDTIVWYWIGSHADYDKLI